jgi:hypothetical protein
VYAISYDSRHKSGCQVKKWLTQLRNRVSDYWAVGVVEWRLRLAVFSLKLRVWIGSAAVSLFGFTAAACVLFVPMFRNVADSFIPSEAILSQLGATYGTILALVLTLSIIPIQRAGEVWSSSIVRIYRGDPVTYITFVLLGVFCAASFLFSVHGIAGISVSIVLAFSLAMLSISLDMLRFYHGHVCRLLDPMHAVGLVLKQAIRTVDKTKVLITRVARLQHRSLNSEQQSQFAIEDFEAAIYPRIDGYPNSINTWSNDLTEIAVKAVARNEKLLAKTAIFALANLTIHYLSSRKHNLTLTPAPEAMFLVSTSDVNVITNRTYEALLEINRAAVAQNDESTAIRVSEAYQAIAINTANLGARAFRDNTAPLTYSPIHYALECVKHAQSKGLDDVAFQAAAILARISQAAPKNVSMSDIHTPVIDGLFNIAMYLYGKRSYTLAEDVNGHQFTILAHLLQQEDYYFGEALRDVLDNIDVLAPLAILNEATAGRLSIVHPLGKAYGLINQTSLGYIFDQAAAILPKVDADRAWINPYHDLIEIADIISEHLRKVAENNEFGDSFLIWDIDNLVKHIAVAIVRLIDHPLRPDHGDVQELIDKFLWILAFYWVAFKGKKSVSKLRADDCCDSLAFIGLLFFSRGYQEVLSACISNVRSILESYCEIAQSLDYYTVGDILAHLSGIRLILVARSNSVLTQQVDQAISAKPNALTDAQWQAAQHAIGLRRLQLEERLGEQGNHIQRPDTAEAILRQLLQNI